MAWVVGELSVGPPSGVDPVGQMRLRIQNKQTSQPIPFPRGYFILLCTRLSPHLPRRPYHRNTYNISLTKAYFGGISNEGNEKIKIEQNNKY